MSRAAQIRAVARARGWSLRWTLAHLVTLGLRALARQRKATDAATRDKGTAARREIARRAARARWDRRKAADS